jgi:hypothetical protein
MPKFLLNLQVQIFKVCQKSEIHIKFKKVLLLELGPAPVFGPPAAHFFFPTDRFPSPHWASPSRPAQLALSAQRTAHRWCPTQLSPPSRENASPRAAFAPLRAWLTGGPHLSSPSSGAAQAPLCATTSSSRHGCRALPRAPSLYG